MIKKILKKYSTDQRFIGKRNTTYKKGTLISLLSWKNTFNDVWHYISFVEKACYFWTNFENSDHCGTASKYVPCMWPLQTSVSSKILRSSDTLSKSGWWICQNQIKIWQPPLLTYLAPILSKPHVIYHTKQPFYKPVLHYISVTYHILWHYISVTHSISFFVTILVGHPVQEFLIASFEWWSSVFVIDSW